MTPVSRNIEFSTVGPKFELCLKPVYSFEMYQTNMPAVLSVIRFYGKNLRMKKPVRRTGSLLVILNFMDA